MKDEQLRGYMQATAPPGDVFARCTHYRMMIEALRHRRQNRCATHIAKQPFPGGCHEFTVLRIYAVLKCFPHSRLFTHKLRAIVTGHSNFSFKCHFRLLRRVYVRP